MLITDEEAKDLQYNCNFELGSHQHEFENYASNTSDIMKVQFNKDVSCENLLSLGNLDKSDDLILNLNKKTKDDIIWQEISTNSQTVDISEIKITHHGHEETWNANELSLTP